MTFLKDIGKSLKNRSRRAFKEVSTTDIKNFSHRLNQNIKLPKQFERLGEGADKIVPFHSIIRLADRDVKNRFAHVPRDRRNLNIIDNNNPVKNKTINIAGVELQPNLTQTDINEKDLSGKEKTMFNNPAFYIIPVVIIGIIIITKNK